MFRTLLFGLSLLFAVSSCQNSETGSSSSNSNRKRALPNSNGGRLDVIVVAKESIWQDKAGEVFRKYFARNMVGLPQAESILNIRQVTPKQFNDLLQRARNVIVIQEGATAFSQEEDQYARPQEYITFSAPTQDSLALLFKKHHEAVVRDIHDSEVRYLQKRITKKTLPVPKTMKEHHVSMQIPEGFELDTKEDNLLVYWNKTLKTQQGLLVYFEPLQEEQVAMGERIIPLRDSITKIYVPGDNEGSYMLVEDYIPPVFTNMTLSGNYAIETRGLWRTEGDFMGGSFISYTIFDETNNQRITADAFLYAPEVNKRNYILEMEAILRTLEITN